MNPLRLCTYLAAALVAVLVHFFPDQSSILYPLAAALAGWATIHPADAKSQSTKDGGHATPGILFSFAFLGLATLAGLCLFPRFARADSAELTGTHRHIPGTIGCWKGDNTCARVILPAGLGGLNLATMSVEGGAFPTGGVGLGVDFWANEWYTVTPGFAVAASAASGAANYANLVFVANVFRFFWAGTMVHITPAFSQWYLLGGIDPLAIAGALGP